MNTFILFKNYHQNKQCKKKDSINSLNSSIRDTNKKFVERSPFIDHGQRRNISPGVMLF